MGDIVAFDATGKFSIGTMTATTVMAGNLYRLTVTADEAFLTDENTVYPVSIDPTLEVSDNTHGAGAIEDASIYQSSPNTKAGNWSYNHCGYVDSSYGVGRTLYRLTGLNSDSTYQTIPYDRVTSAYFYIREATGSAGIPVYLYANRGSASWTETGVTWNNAGVTLGTKYATVSPSYGNFATYDITELVQAWLNDEVEDPTAGFVLVSSNETSVDKTFYSSEHTTTTSRPYVKVSYSTNITLSKYVLDLDVNATYTFTATTNPSGQTITWSSSNTEVATVSTTGTVQAKSLGQATITATVPDGSVASCIVYVTIADGVYYISNTNNSGLVAGTSGTVTDATNVEAITKVTSGDSRYYQLWKVVHLQSGHYAIRPINKLNMAMSVTDSNVDIKQIGSSNSYTAVPAHARWTISLTTGGYIIRNSNSSGLALKVPTSDYVNGTPMTVGAYSSSGSGYVWTLTRVTGVAGKLFLYDKSTGEEVSGTKRYVPTGCTLTLDDLDLELYIFASTGTDDKSGTWTSGTPSVATVNSSGTITSKAAGTATLTATSSYASNTVQYTLICVSSGLTLDVEYDNGYLTRYTTDAVSRINTQIAALQDFYMKEFGVWIKIGSPVLTQSLADECQNQGINEGCGCCTEYFCSNSGVNAETYELIINELHHKNLYNIMVNARPDNSQNRKAIYTGHGTCSVRPEVGHKSNLLDDGSHLYGAAVDILGIMGIAYDDSVDAESQTTIHEAGHLFFSADDHYDGETDNSNDSNEGHPYSDECIYGAKRRSLSEPKLCNGCKQTIEENIESLFT